MEYIKVFDSKKATHDEWLNFRRSGIGGSDMASILGVSKYRSPLDVWLDKTGQTEAKEDSLNRFTYWGNVLEPIVANEFSKETGLKIRNNNYTLRNKRYPFLQANIDREIVGVDAGLECKTTSIYNADEWDGDNVPDAYYIQCQHYMAVTGKKEWWIACLIGGNDFKYKLIPRNDEVIQEIIKAGSKFWDKVQKGTMPDADASEAYAKALAKIRHPEDKAIRLPETAEIYIKQWKMAKKQKKQAEAEIRANQNVLETMLNNSTKGTCGDYTVTWGKPYESIRLDSKKLKEDHPDIYDKYKKISVISGRFNIK